MSFTPGPTAPVIRPNEVKGFLGHAEKQPDRYFYALWQEEDTVWELDGYALPLPTGRTAWTVLITCPRCLNVLKLDTERKPLLVDERGLTTAEPIQCSYPGQFGGLCSWRVELEPPKPSQRIITVRGNKVRLDAVIKKV